MQLTPEACRAARALLGWSIRDLARAAGLSPTTVLGLEQGGSSKPETLGKIADSFATQGVELIAQRSRTGAVLVHARRPERVNGGE